MLYPRDSELPQNAMSVGAKMYHLASFENFSLSGRNDRCPQPAVTRIGFHQTGKQHRIGIKLNSYGQMGLLRVHCLLAR